MTINNKQYSCVSISKLCGFPKTYFPTSKDDEVSKILSELYFKLPPNVNFGSRLTLFLEETIKRVIPGMSIACFVQPLRVNRK